MSGTQLFGAFFGPFHCAENRLAEVTGMLTLDGNELVFCFPDLSENARLTIGFRLAESPEKVAGLVYSSSADGFVFATLGRVIMHLDPRLPFAVLATIQGRNVLTGEDRVSSLVRPQNYFATPPQRMIDGYLDGQHFARFTRTLMNLITVNVSSSRCFR